MTPSGHHEKLTVSATPNMCCWSVDFMSDVLMNEQRFRTFNVLGDFNREAQTTMPAAKIVRVLNRVVAWRGYPAKVCLDNGPELISVAVVDWAECRGVDLDIHKPGKPTQNAYIERFNRTFRHEVLAFYVFSRLKLG
jgi:putative transposase